MSDYPRSSYEPDKGRWSRAATCRAVRATLRGLRASYKVPQDLPHEILTLLVELDEEEE